VPRPDHAPEVHFVRAVLDVPIARHGAFSTSSMDASYPPGRRRATLPVLFTDVLFDTPEAAQSSTLDGSARASEAGQ